MSGHRTAGLLVRRDRLPPNLRCIESKSLKLYLWSFRDRAAFCEQLAADIAAEVHRAAEPLQVRVTVTQHTRGGIVTEATAELP